jgi:hypothetical protein
LDGVSGKILPLIKKTQTASGNSSAFVFLNNVGGLISAREQPQSQGLGEFLRRDACHFEGAPQSAKGNLPVHGDDAATLALRRDFLEDGMAATLAINKESEPL